jgi:uncharacterized protein (TIRG00374 family)
MKNEKVHMNTPMVGMKQRPIITKRGTIAFFAISLAAAFIVLSLSWSSMTWQSLRHIKIFPLFLILVATILMWWFDLLRLRILTWGAHANFNMRFGFQLVWVNLFVCAVTPFEGGGGPAQILMMTKRGISVGKGMAITSIRSALTLTVLSCTTLLVLFFWPEMVPQWPLKKVFLGVSIPVFLSMMILAGGLFFPDKLKIFGQAIAYFLQRYRFIKPKWTERWTEFLFNMVDDLNETFKNYFIGGKKYLLGATLLTILFFCTQFSVAPFIFWSLGVPIPFLKAILIQGVLTLMIYFIPTPGSSGVAEGGFFLLFSPLVPSPILGISVMLWRFFTVYLGVLLGIFSLIYLVPRDTTSEEYKKG